MSTSVQYTVTEEEKIALITHVTLTDRSQFPPTN